MQTKYWTVTYCGPFGVRWMSFKDKAAAIRCAKRLKGYQPKMSYGEYFPS